MATHRANALQAIRRVLDEMCARAVASGMDLAAWQGLLAYAVIEVDLIEELKRARRPTPIQVPITGDEDAPEGA